MTDLRHLTDDQLVAEIASLNGVERQATATLVAHLAELHARDLHLVMGFKSLFGFCRAVLHLFEHESYNRMEAAHAVRRFPVILAMLAEGLLHLTAVRLLAPHLGDENHLALLGGAIHKSKDEVKELLARWFPKAAVATSIRRVATSSGSQSEPADVRVGDDPLSAASVGWAAGDNAHTADRNPTDRSADENAKNSNAPSGSRAAAEGGASSTPGNAPTRRKATIDPLSAETFSMRLTARRATIERLRRAQEILSHAVPDGNVDEILYRALGALIEDEGRKKLAAARPRPDRRRSARPANRDSRPPDPASRTVAAEVEREVRARDGEQCAFISKDGRRCEERRFLELHHRKPWIAGGGGTVRNISLRCQAHNQYEWRVYVAPIRAAQEMMATRSTRVLVPGAGGTRHPPRARTVVRSSP